MWVIATGMTCRDIGGIYVDEIKWYQEEITKVVNGQKNLTWLKLVYIYVSRLKK